MNKLAFGLMTGLTAVVLTGCGGSSSSGGSGSSVDSCSALNSESFDCRAMLEGIVTNTVKPLVAELVTQSQALKTETGEYCSSLAGANEATTPGELGEAQQAWQDVMNTWQQLEVMQFGPIQQQREQFYNWPLNDTCKVDDEVVRALATGYDISSVTPARRGLSALEHVLFNPDLNQSCPSTNTSTSLADWNTKAAADKRADRCAYAEKVTTDLVNKANTLDQSMASYQLSNNMGSLQAAANLVSDALFYIDKQTKDAKVTDLLPSSTSGSFDSNAIEFEFSKTTKEAINSNLTAALKLMEGIPTQPGLSAYLTAAGQQDVADNMIAGLNSAISLNNGIADNYADIIDADSLSNASACINATVQTAQTDLEKLCAMDDAIRGFTNELKGQFVLTLGFSVPREAEGDND